MRRIVSNTGSQRTERRRGSNAARTRFPHVLAMTWRYGLFAHWPVEPAALAPHIPEPLDLETWDGRAWISVLPFALADAGLRGSPQLTRLSFPEVNVRTYVSYRGDPAVFFCSIDLGQPLLAGLVGRTTRLPVAAARMRVHPNGESVAFSSERDGARFEATYQPTGESTVARPGSFAYWATARRRLYAPEEAGGVLGAEIAHEPWPLQPATAEIRENTLFEANDLPEPIGEPTLHYCDKLGMTGSIARRLRE
ncbi:DUF2071 domain-containing protein [Halobacteria archaeon AArc-dxtr1]|nr:DUF2071 domain-containing protein [Halobacteria archaeon AArc-dxtr1]